MYVVTFLGMSIMFNTRLLYRPKQADGFTGHVYGPLRSHIPPKYHGLIDRQDDALLEGCLVSCTTDQSTIETKYPGRFKTFFVQKFCPPYIIADLNESGKTAQGSMNANVFNCLCDQVDFDRYFL